MSVPTENRAAATAVRPFRVGVPQEDLVELRRRIGATRWPERETVHDDAQGVPLATMQDLARCWAADHDWRQVEARLNALPQFMTEFDGLDIHFLHVRSRHEDALPLIITHGWPGSIIEQLKLIGPLTDPTAHGASQADAFEVVIPPCPVTGSRPSRPPPAGTRPGSPAPGSCSWAAWATPGSWPRAATGRGRDPGHGHPGAPGAGGHPRQHGRHRPGSARQGFETGAPPPPGLSNEERTAYQQLAAFMLDHGDGTGQPGLVKGVLEGTYHSDLTRDDLLDNITLYWLTNTGVSAARLYWENTADLFDAKAITIPFAISVFPDELYQAPRGWAERAYPDNLIHYHQLDRGGHFAAWEQPQLLSQELRTAFQTLR